MVWGCSSMIKQYILKTHFNRKSQIVIRYLWWYYVRKLNKRWMYFISFKIRNFSSKCCRPANLLKESFCLEGILPSTSTSTNCLWFLIYLSFIRLFVCLFVCSFVCSFARCCLIKRKNIIFRQIDVKVRKWDALQN